MELLRNSGASAVQMSAEIGVSTSLLYRCSREFSDMKAAEERPAYEDLERENRRLRGECFL